MEAVLQIKRTVEEKMQNPFHPSLTTDKLMNMSTGQILAATTLVDAKRLGLKAMDAAPTTNADKIVQPKMETFATHLKKIQKKIDTVKEVIREESAVTRALCFAQNLSDEARTEAFREKCGRLLTDHYDDDDDDDDDEIRAIQTTLLTSLFWWLTPPQT
ncbi:hypothetical protein GQR58_011151 [Nymphon striatum]|nr:hypothetical protein GQR58_011151 [Nymphon striatum]